MADDPIGGGPESTDWIRRGLVGATWIAMSVFWGFALTRWIDPRWPHVHAAFLSPGQDFREHLRDLSALLGHSNPYVLRDRLNDTTPPSTAYLFLPFSWLSTPMAELASVISSLAALAASEAMLLATVTRLGRARALLVSAGFLSPLAAAGLLPVFETIVNGQLYLWLMALVIADLLVIQPRRSGVLIGAVTALVFWPGLFVVAVIARSRGRGMLLFAAGAIGVTAAAAIAAPSASWDYFTSVLPSGHATLREVVTVLPHGLGSLAVIGNQSLHGWFLRPPLSPWLASPWAYGVAALGIIAVGTITAWRLLRQSEMVVAMIVLAITCLLATPFGWLHHWVWVVLFPFGAISCWHRRRALAIVLVLGLIPFIHGVGVLVTAQGAVAHEGIVTMIRINAPTLVGLIILGAATCSSLWAAPAARARHASSDPFAHVAALPF